MGAICSKSSTHSGGHTLVSSTTGGPNTSAIGSHHHTGRQQRQAPRQTADARRSQAAAAAEQRMKAENKRGVSAANPNSGQLAARLEASKTAPLAPEPTRREDALIWD